jgi:muramoyltetrapeptide carboxypeptidase
MNRKYFISSFITAGVSISALKSFAIVEPVAGNFTAALPTGDEASRLPNRAIALPVADSHPSEHTSLLGKHKFVVPPYLKPGDTIAITCPAGYISLPQIAASVMLLESWGFKVVIGNAVGRKDFTFGGSDGERLADFQHMLDDTSISAIMCARGGYGAIRIIDKLDFRKFTRAPKWIIGFSDITVLHSHLQSKLSIGSLHSKMCNSFPKDWTLADPVQIETILSIRQALTGEKLRYFAAADPENKLGVAEGILVGGNLSMLVTLSGTPSELNTDGKLLFIEDTGEYLYSIDRMLWNLKRTGKLDKLAGLIIGGFKLKADEPGEEFGISLQHMVLEKVSEYNYPVCFDFPVGHQKNNFALKCGAMHQLAVTREGTTLTTL